MTSTVTTWTTSVLLGASGEMLSSSVGLIAILLLLGLLVQKELARSYGAAPSRYWGQMLNIAIAPLLLVFGTVMIARLLALFP